LKFEVPSFVELKLLSSFTLLSEVVGKNNLDPSTKSIDGKGVAKKVNLRMLRG
jgi:hypothetical protein